jgi:hypothetical protein
VGSRGARARGSARDTLSSVTSDSLQAAEKTLTVTLSTTSTRHSSFTTGTLRSISS